MADPSVFDPLRIPVEILIAVDNRDFHFVFQRWHYLCRMLHVLATAWFFGGVALLDLQLIGLKARLPLEGLLEGVLPSLYWSFGISFITGLLLFLYDPVHVGAHAYFAPKLILIAAGLLNAFVYHRMGLDTALGAELSLPLQTRFAGLLSLAIWSGVTICAALNAEGVPKVFLR